MTADAPTNPTTDHGPTDPTVIVSPGATTGVTLSLEPDRSAALTVTAGNTPMLRVDGIGLQDGSGARLAGPFESIEELERAPHTDEFTLPTGKARTSTLTVNRGLFRLRCGGEGSAIDNDVCIEVVAADEGVAYRLILNAVTDHGDDREILAEPARLSTPPGTVAWLQDHDRVGQVTPAYEGWHANGIAVDTLQPSTAGWTLPALFETNDKWLLLTEAAVDATNGGSHLNVAEPGGPLLLQRPHADEGDPSHPSTIRGPLPLRLPWRIAVVGDLDTVVSSNMVRHLSPAADDAVDYSWVKPGRVAWSWWSEHDSPKNPDALRASVEVAAKMGWEYALIDANWNHLPEGTVEDLVAHGRRHNVEVMLWYNSGGPNNFMGEEPRDLMTDPEIRRAELRRISALGVTGIKVDFFHTDKPQGIAQFHDILADAAEVQIMVNFHGCTAPRGWSRTHPNLMTTEGVRGAEWYRLSDDYGPRAPVNNTILAFSRNVVGSMDYTPVALSDLARNRHTSNGHELALAVVFESGLLHLCDAPAHYAKESEPVRRFLSSVPVAWDETHLLDGRPGSHVVVARRADAAWYLGAINGGPTTLSTELDLQRLGIAPEHRFDVLSCSDDDPRRIEHTTVTAAEISAAERPLNPHGGWVMWSSVDVNS